MPEVQNPHCAALRVEKGLLQRGERAARGKAFDGLHRLAVNLRGEHQAAARREAVDEHRACAAGAMFAAEMRPGEFEFLAQEIREVLARLDAALQAPCR